MGLSYTPTYEKPQYSWMLKYGIKPEFKSKMEGEGATSWMGAQEGTPTSVEYNLSSKVPYDKVTRHEVGHVSLHGNGKNAEDFDKNLDKAGSICAKVLSKTIEKMQNNL